MFDLDIGARTLPKILGYQIFDIIVIYPVCPTIILRFSRIRDPSS